MIDLRPLMATIRRKRRVWLVTGLVGLIVGASLHLVIPRKYAAVTDLYLAVPAGSIRRKSWRTTSRSSRRRWSPSKRSPRADSTSTPHSLLTHYTGLAVSDNIMSITFNASSQIDATSGATAVAHAFLAVRARELGLQTDALVRGLQFQISSFNTEIDNLNAKISSLSSATPDTQSSNQLTDLVNQRSADESQVSQLQAQVDQALLNEQLTEHTTSILDPAAVNPVSAKKVILVDGLSGLVAGLAIGLAVVIFGALLSERPVRSFDRGSDARRASRVEPRALPRPARDAQEAVVPVAERAHSDPPHDRAPVARPSRICARIGARGRHHRNSRADGVGGRCPGARPFVRGAPGGRGRRSRQPASGLPPRPRHQTRGDGNVSASGGRRRVREGARDA